METFVRTLAQLTDLKVRPNRNATLVEGRQLAIIRSCQTCELLQHMKRGRLKLKEYEKLKSGNNGSWIYVVCLFQVLPQEISFSSLNDSLNDLVGSNSNIVDEANDSL